VGLDFRRILVVTPSATLGYPLRLGSVLASQLFTEFTEFYNVYMLNVISKLTATALNVSSDNVADRTIGECHGFLLSGF
jgi:hypothetical protein